MICEVMLGHWSVKEEGPEDLCVFNRMEYYCYVGIRHFGLGEYEEAISHFSYAIKEKSLMDLEGSAPGEEVEEEQEGAEAVIEAETKQNELHYLNYNLFLAYLANGEKKKAYEVFIRDLLPAKEHFLRS